VTTHNAIKAAGQLLKAIGISVGLGSEEEGVSRLGETLTPIVNPWERPDGSFLRRERLAAGSFAIVSAAGTRCEALLYNPPGTTLVTMKRLRFSSALAAVAAFNYRLFRGAAPPAGFVDANTGPLDTRDPQLIAARATTARVMQAANAAADGGIVFDNVNPQAANVIIVDEAPVILAPGTGFILELGANGANTVVGGFRWLERVMLPGEQARG
jgi:hypothetical protein